jgi:hypothetical protein
MAWLSSDWLKRSGTGRFIAAIRPTFAIRHWHLSAVTAEIETALPLS